MKKLISLFLSLVMCCCFTTAAFASNATTSYQKQYIEARFSDFSNVDIYLTEDDFDDKDSK